LFALTGVAVLGRAWQGGGCPLRVGLALVSVALGAPAAASGATNNIFTVAGTGVPGPGAEGVPAVQAQLAFPFGVAATADGGMLIADLSNHRVRRVSSSGTITSVAGTGVPGFSNDGGPAAAAQLNAPFGVTPTPDGGMLIADTANHRVRRVSPGGTITTVAGSGGPGFAGDGGPAILARLDLPIAVAMSGDGGFVFVDIGNLRVRRVSPGGTISTVAGNGGRGFSGDGGPATAAQLNSPTGVAVAADGSVLIADQLNNRIRRVSPGGTIATVAGSGAPGISGDGGPATAARLNGPVGLAVTPDGGFVFTDSGNHRVRRVSPRGTITTVAGTGLPGFAGDGGPAAAAQLNVPAGVAVTREGGLLIAERDNHRVRFVDTDLRGPRTGAPGESGPPGPRGPAGPAGPVRSRLAVALAADRLRARPRQRLRVRYGATADATVELRVLRAGRRVARARGRARSGRNAIRLRLPRKAGRYRLVLTAVAADGQRTGDRARLTIGTGAR